MFQIIKINRRVGICFAYFHRHHGHEMEKENTNCIQLESVITLIEQSVKEINIIINKSAKKDAAREEFMTKTYFLAIRDG